MGCVSIPPVHANRRGRRNQACASDNPPGSPRKYEEMFFLELTKECHQTFVTFEEMLCFIVFSISYSHVFHVFMLSTLNQCFFMVFSILCFSLFSPLSLFSISLLKVSEIVAEELFIDFGKFSDIFRNSPVALSGAHAWTEAESQKLQFSWLNRLPLLLLLLLPLCFLLRLQVLELCLNLFERP